jgi:hypothetical protein
MVRRWSLTGHFLILLAQNENCFRVIVSRCGLRCRVVLRISRWFAKVVDQGRTVPQFAGDGIWPQVRSLSPCLSLFSVYQGCWEDVCGTGRGSASAGFG